MKFFLQARKTRSAIINLVQKSPVIKCTHKGKEQHNMVVKSIDSGSWLLEFKL